MPTLKKDSEYADSVYSYLASVERGRDVDFRSPLYGDVPREDIVEKWMDILDQLPNSPLTELEAKERGKIGTTSIILPWSERRESLEGYFQPTDTNPIESALNLAVAKVTALVRKGSLSPIGLTQAYESSAKSTNWGLPYFTKGSSKYLTLAEAGLRASMHYPSVVGTRVQANGTDKPKQRIVWMFPHSVSLYEQRYIKPIVNAVNELPHFAFVDLEITRDEVHSWVKEAVQNNYTMWSFDASSYDQSINRELIQLAFGIIKVWFGNRTKESEMELTQLEEYFSTSGLLTPDGIKQGRNGKVPSGSGFTNIIDTLVNLIVQYYIAEVLGLDMLHVKAQGDDAIVIFRNTVNIDQLSEVAKTVGITVNPEKNILSSEAASFLQDLYSSTFSGVRSSIRVLNGAMSYERLVPGWNKWMDVIRWLSQLNNANRHPLFDELIQFIKLGDKYDLGCNFENVRQLYLEAGGVDTIEETLKIAAFRGPGKALPTDSSPVLLQLREHGCFNT